MGRYFTPILDTIAAVLGMSARGNIVADPATRACRALQSARSFLLRLTGRATDASRAVALRRLQPAVARTARMPERQCRHPSRLRAA